MHAHLEGCFEPAVLAQWAAQAGVPMPRPRDRLLQFEGLADFLHFLDWACGLASTIDASFANADVKSGLLEALTRW